MEMSKFPSNRLGKGESAAGRETVGGSVSLFLRLWSYGGPLQPPTGLTLEQDPEVPALIQGIIRESKGEIAEWQPELLSARFDDALHAISAAKGLQRCFLTFHRKTEPRQIVPSILIYNTNYEKASGANTAVPEDMLANVTSAQILISESIYELVRSVPGFKFNPKPVREAGETFGPEAIYELLWTDESTYGHLRKASRTDLDNAGRYQIQEELGRGAMGAVYKAYDRLIGRTVALKTISIDRNTPDRDDLIERLKQEAKAAGGLDHPNIITIYDVGQEGDVVYLSMQFVEGKTLLELLAEDGVPSLPILISWADQISGAVGFAHARGVIHRDLKPANLMLTTQGVIKVLDFGIAKVENSALTQTGLVVGTPSYMAPEQVEGKKVDHRSDIFALGSVFYELVTREKPFRGDVTTILYKIVNEDPVAPSLINPALPGGVNAIIRKALAKNPNERFQTCEEMRNAFLEQAALLKVPPPSSMPVVTAVPKPVSGLPASVPHFLPQPSRRIWPRIAAGLVLALILGSASWISHTWRHTGSLPTAVTRLVSTLRRTWSRQISTKAKPEQSAAEQPHTTASDQTGPDSTLNAIGSAGAKSDAQPSEAPNHVVQPPTLGASEGSGASTTPQQPPATGQLSGSQPISNGAQLLKPPGSAQTSQSSSASDPLGTAPSPVPAQQSDKNQRAGETARAADVLGVTGDSAKKQVSSGTEEGQSVASDSTKRPSRKPKDDVALTVDGFSRRDVPELLRQADAAAGRGDYRLAHYEYNLILKLDRSNATARAALHRVEAAEQSH